MVKLITPYQVETQDGETWTRHTDTLEMETARGAVTTVYGQEASQLWADLLAEACSQAGLREDASIFEIRTYLES